MTRDQLLEQLRDRPGSARVITALDVPTAGEALALADSLGTAGALVKVGLQLFSAGGPPVVEGLRQRGRDVFLDLKYHDIPNTVASAARVAASMGATMVTLHAAGGRRMMAAAAEALAETSAETSGKTRPALLAVTILTSLAREDLDEAMPGADELRDRIIRLAKLAWDSGCDGIVCAAADLPFVREAIGPEPLTVTPGIRPASAATDDQRRIATPAAAVRDGADFLVIGRPITRAPDPTAALRDIGREIATALPR